MIVAELKAGGGALGEGAKMRAHALTNGLERLETIGASAGVEANALGRAVIDGNEHRRLALAGHDRGQIAAPHDVDPLGGDRAVVGSRAMRAAGTLMRQQAMLAHEPQDAAPTGADAGEAQPRPQLAVALAVERAVLQELPDLHHQVLIRHGPERARALALNLLGWAAVAIEGRP